MWPPPHCCHRNCAGASLAQGLCGRVGAVGCMHALGGVVIIAHAGCVAVWGLRGCCHRCTQAVWPRPHGCVGAVRAHRCHRHAQAVRACCHRHLWGVVMSKKVKGRQQQCTFSTSVHLIHTNVGGLVRVPHLYVGGLSVFMSRFHASVTGVSNNKKEGDNGHTCTAFGCIVHTAFAIHQGLGRVGEGGQPGQLWLT